MTQDIRFEFQKVKTASYALSLLSEERRNEILQAIADKLRIRSAKIISENAKDLELMSPEDPMIDRLLLTEERIQSMATDIENVIGLSSPLGTVHDQKILPNGLKIEKRVVPLGVVAVIYESRPNVTMDVFSLCFKTGNACILKGGKEAIHSNTALVNLILDVLHSHHIDPSSLYFLPPQKEATQVLFQSGLTRMKNLFACLIGLVAALPAISGCNTLKGAAKGVESIGSGLQKDVEKVEQTVTN
jgi:glutamate-5-semialdehyde dehydrogenase